MNRDAYSTFVGAKGVAFAWIGAAFGPTFIAVGLESSSWKHLAIGLAGVLLVAMLVVDGIRAKKVGATSDFLAFTVVPSILLIFGATLAFFLSIQLS